MLEPTENNFEIQEATQNSERILSTNNRNIQNIEGWLRPWLTHLRLNGPLITEDFEKRDANVTAAPLPPWVERRDIALCCGSGPSLELIAPYLKDFKGILIAGPTNGGFCLKHGRAPDFIVFVDASELHWIHMKRVPYPKETVMIVAPTTHPRVCNMYPNNRYWYKPKVQNENYQWFNTVLDLMMPLSFTNYMYQAGCTANQELVLTMLFYRMKIHPIKKVLLAGVDYAYKENQSRVTDWHVQDNTGKWYSNTPTTVRTRANLRRAENGMLTDRSMIGYKRSLYILWDHLGQEKNPYTVYNISDGINDAIPRPYGNLTLEENIKLALTTYCEGSDTVAPEYVGAAFRDYIQRNGND